MKFKELKNKPKAELTKILKESNDKLCELRFKIANRSLKNVKDVKNTRKVIAQILTALNDKNREVVEKVQEIKK